MPALNQLRLITSRAAYPAPALIALSQPGTYTRQLSSIHQLLVSPRSQPSSLKSSRNYSQFAIHKPATPSVAKMSTMPASHGHNEACCNIPPVVTKGYKAQGSYDEVDGLKTCTEHPLGLLDQPANTINY